MFLFGPPNVEKLKSRGNVNGLIKALGYHKDSGETHPSAIPALVKIGAPAVEPLIAALKDVDRDVRYTAIKTAIKALSQIGDPLAGEPLIAALKDGDRYVRYATAEALGAIGDARVVEPLITSLSANDPDTRRTVAQAQVRLYQKPDLSQTCRQQIFAVRKSITDIHDDQPHIDESRDCFSNRPHADRNLDVEFLL